MEANIMTASDEAQSWNGTLGQKWAAYALQFNQLLQPLNQPLLQAAELNNAKNVLDIGCGAGLFTLHAAQSLSPKSQIEGIDFSNVLIETARKHATTTNLRFTLADLDQYQTTKPFDRAISRLGLTFFPNPVSSFSHLRNLLTKTGKLAFVCWNSLKHNQWALLPYKIARNLLENPPPRPPPGTPGPFAFDDKHRIYRILTQSGWTNIQIHNWNSSITLPGNTLEDAAQFAVEFGPAARLIRDFNIQKNLLTKPLIQQFQQLGLQDGNVSLKASAWIVQAMAT